MAQPPPSYIKCLQRGTTILAKLDNPTTPQSPWTDPTSLPTHKWATEKVRTPTPSAGLAKFLTDPTRNLSAAADNDHPAAHNQTFMTFRHADIPGKSELAYYKQTYNLVDGSIFITSLKGPRAAAAVAAAVQGSKVPAQLTTTNLPDLRHWSDVTFLIWRHLLIQEEEKKKRDTAEPLLKMVVHCVVSNEETLEVVRYLRECVLLQEGRQGVQKGYPGYTFTREGDGDCFTALLGTPNGIGTGYLLAEHKLQMGGKGVVVGIQVFEEEGEVFLVLHLG